MPQHSPEYPMLRNYLELVSELPWKKSSMEMIDISKAKEVQIYLFSFLSMPMNRKILSYISLSYIWCDLCYAIWSNIGLKC